MRTFLNPQKETRRHNIWLIREIKLSQKFPTIPVSYIFFKGNTGRKKDTHNSFSGFSKFSNNVIVIPQVQIFFWYHWYGTYWMKTVTKYFQRILTFFRLSGWVAFLNRGHFLSRGLIIRLFITLRVVFFYWSTSSAYKNWKSMKH